MIRKFGQAGSPRFGEAGAAPVLVLVAVIGLIAFLGISTNASFRSGLFASLFPKPLSHAATNTVTIDGSLSVHAISPYIYGTAANGDPYQKVMGTSISRWGGNQVSRYNWETEDSNSGSDWGLCNQAYLGRGAFSNVDYGSANNPGFSIRNTVTGNNNLGMATLFTVPTVGWVAKDGNNGTCSVNVSSTEGPPLTNQLNDEDAISGYDPTANRNLTSIKSQMKKGSAFVYPPNKTDNVVYQDELLSWLVGQTGKANQTGVKFYAFDNEFDLWSSTHRDIHPAFTGYDALWTKYLAFANAVKDIDSTAQTTGPVNWGWIAYWNSPLQDRASHGNLPLLKWFLRQAKTAEVSSGRRLLDVLDVHYYPQGGQALSTDVSTSMQALRLRSTRELWDPTYSTESWQTCCEGGPQIQIINKLKQWIAEEYPGTKIGITEWNWGADNHINGALTIADILGVFGREDVYLANYWTTPSDQSPGYWAWRMFRNVDGNFLGFGDTSISSVIDPGNVDKYAVYASKQSGTNETKVMLINKDPSNNQTATLNLKNISGGGTAKVYQYSKSDTTKINRLSDLTNINTANYTYTMSPYSITLLVFDPNVGPGTSTGAPVPTAAPTAPPATTPFSIYSDATSWANWSWGSTIDFASSVQVKVGTKSISWLPGAWAGLYLHSDTGVNTATYRTLHFAMFGTNSANSFQVTLTNNTASPTNLGSVDLVNYGGVPTAGTWKTYDIPLSALGADNAMVGGFMLFSNDGNAQTQTVYVDDISLVGVAAGSTPIPTVSNPVTPSPAPNPLLGDINGSKKVDILDYNLLITDYGATSGVGLRSDINNSGKVDILDYNLLITNYGKSIP